jgi:hypothetical protein
MNFQPAAPKTKSGHVVVPLYTPIVLRHRRATPPGDYAFESGLWQLPCNRDCRVLGIRSASEQEILSGGFMSETGTKASNGEYP